jgi:D-alanyl-D-alanine carboxypeptidase
VALTWKDEVSRSVVERFRDPWAAAVAVERLEHDLAVGAARVVSDWKIGEIVEYMAPWWVAAPLAPAVRGRMGGVADRLSAILRDLPAASRGDAHTLAAWLYSGAGQTETAVAAAKAALRLPGEHPAAASLLEDLRYQRDSQRGKPVVDAYVKAEMARQRIPGLSVAIVRSGKVILAKGYGLANVEHSVPATRDTVYPVGSLTKSFTATAIMMLVEAGKLSLDERVCNYLPDLIPAAWSEVTVRHLLSHTAGVPDDDAKIMGLRERTPTDLIRSVSHLPLDFHAGEKFAYSNRNYTLLGILIEKTSGKPYGEFVAERIFQPLEMTASRVTDLRAVIKNRASGYLWENDSLRLCEWPPFNLTASGGIISTVADLLKFDAALYTEKLLRKSTLEQMWTPTRLKDGTTPTAFGDPLSLGWRYGLGWRVYDSHGHRRVEHDGGLGGAMALLSRIPEERYSIALLTNRMANWSAFQAGIDRLCRPVKPLEDRDAQTTQRLRRALLNLAEGKAVATEFTPEAHALLSAELKYARAFYQSLGPLSSFSLVEQRNEGKNRIYHYRTVFGRTAWIHRFVLTSEGKIAELGTEPG